MPARSTPLSNFPVVRSSDPELVADRLCSVYGAVSFDLGKASTSFEVDANHLQIGSLGLSYFDYVGDISVRFGEASFVRQIFSIAGAGRYASATQAGDISPRSWTPVLDAYEPLKLDFKSGCRHFVLRIEADSLVRHLRALTGQDVTRPPIFDGSHERQPAMEALKRRVFQFATDYNERGLYFSELAAAEVERMVIMKFLMCHRHNYTHLLLREPLPVPSTAVRAVEEYIEANWDKPVDVETMVAVAKVSARSLFRQFKKDRGYTPADFAKRVRLHRAREMLEQSNAGDSVIQIALKCGFQNPGHFARDYKSLFGELPSVTMQGARKATYRAIVADQRN